MIGQELVSLGLLFIFAIIGGIIALRFKQPSVIGLLVIGAIVGPNSLNIIRDIDVINLMTELGAILLLFTIGLEFSLPKFVKIGFKVMMIGIFKIGITIFLIYEVSLLIGLSQKVAIALGIISSLSSTVAIVKILQSKGLYKERHEVPLLIGILIIEDIFAVFILTLISGMKGNANIINVIENLILAITVLLLAYYITLKISRLIISWFLRNCDDEAITYIALAICISFSSLAYYLGLFPSIGAFLAGSIVASLSQVKSFEIAIKPYSLTFSSLFFISMGTMVNLSTLKQNILLVLFLLALIVILRFLSVIPLSHLFANFNKEQAIFSSIALISVSEFSLIISQAITKFDNSLDFVSITAFVIFITAIIMSFSINHYSKLTGLFNHPSSRRWMAKPKSMSNYIQLFFEQIDIENADTNYFKKKVFNIIFLLPLNLLLLIGWSKLHQLFIRFGFPVWADYILHLLSSLAFVYILYLSIKVIKDLYRVTVVILSNINLSRSIRISRYILNNLLIVFSIFIIVLMSPGILMMINAPNWVNIFPFLLLALVLLMMNKVLNLVNRIHKQGGIFHLQKDPFSR